MNGFVRGEDRIVEHRRSATIACYMMGCWLLGSLIGCDDSYPETWQVSFPATHGKACPPVRVLHHNEVIASYDWQRFDEMPISHDISGALLYKEEYREGGEDFLAIKLSTDFRFEQLTPFGWREFIEPSEREKRISWNREGDELSFEIPEPTSFLLIDNRNHKAVTITCGELPLPVEANSMPTFWFDFDGNIYKDIEEDVEESEEKTTWELQLDGAPIGKMTKKERCLVDVSGERKYFLQEIIYSANELSPFHTGPSSANFEKKHLHQFPDHLQKIDYLFTSAPKEVETFGGFETSRWQLTEFRLE